MPANFSIPLHPFTDIYDSNHDWGGEFRFINEPPNPLGNEDKGYCAKMLYLGNELPSSLHYHKIKKETFCVLFGEVGVSIYDDQAVDEIYHINILKPGDKLTIEPGTKHQFRALNNEPALILEASTYHDDSDTYRD